MAPPTQKSAHNSTAGMSSLARMLSQEAPSTRNTCAFSRAPDTMELSMPAVPNKAMTRYTKPVITVRFRLAQSAFPLLTRICAAS